MFELRDELLLFLNENNGTLSQFLTDEMWIAILTYLRVWHTLKLLLALQGTVATCKARFGGLIDIKVLLQNSSGIFCLKVSNWMAPVKLVAHSKGPLF